MRTKEAIFFQHLKPLLVLFKATQLTTLPQNIRVFLVFHSLYCQCYVSQLLTEVKQLHLKTGVVLKAHSD